MTYEATILADSPTSYWPLNDPGTWTDATGHGYALSAVGTPTSFTTTTGPVAGESAPLFSGSNGLYRASTFSFTPYIAGVPQPFSVEFWQYGFAADYAGLFWWGADSAAQSAEALALSCMNDGTLRIHAQNVHQQPASVGLERDGTAIWHHIVLTYDGSSYAYYIDGALKTVWDYNSPNSPFIATPPQTALYLGYPPTGLVSVDDRPISPFAGALAHVAWYPAALTFTQVNAHNAAASPPSVSYRAVLSYSTSTAMDLLVYGTWTPSTAITISLGGAVQGTYHSDGTGSFPLITETDFAPPNVPTGYYLVEATDGVTTLRVNAQVAAPEIQTGFSSATDRAVLSVGDTLQVLGDTFVPSEVVALTIDGASAGTTTADGSGGISHNLTIPALTPGVHTLAATGAQGANQMDFYVIYASSATSVAYRAEVLSDAPAAFLPLTEAGGGPYADLSSGAAHGGTRLGGQTTTGTGIFPAETAPRLLPLVGTPTPIDYISLASASTLPQQSAWTYELWVSSYLTGSTYFDPGYVWNIDHLAGAGYHNLLSLQFSVRLSTNLWTFNHFPGSPQGTIWSWTPEQYAEGLQPNPAKGEIWYHLVATWDGSTAAFYINGAPVMWNGFDLHYARDAPSVWRGAGFNQPLPETVSGAYLGGNSTGTTTGGGYWLGRLAYFAAYDHALAPERVLCHWNAAVSGNLCLTRSPRNQVYWKR